MNKYLYKLLLLSNILAITPQIFADPATSSNDRVITATGNGSVAVKQTLAIIQISVTAREKTPQKAQQEISTRSNQLLQSLKKTANLGIQTTGISVYPNWNYSSKQPQIDGYNGQYTVSVKTKIENTGTIIDAATNAGASIISNPQLLVSDNDRELAEQKAIADATQSAKKRADTALGALGLKPKSVTQITVTTNNPSVLPYNMPMMRTNLAQTTEAMPTPIEAGNQQITAEVTISESY